MNCDHAEVAFYQEPLSTWSQPLHPCWEVGGKLSLQVASAASWGLALGGALTALPSLGEAGRGSLSAAGITVCPA